MQKVQFAEGIEVAPLRLGTAFSGAAWIYGLTIASCALVNIIVTHFPIGPWEGAEIAKQFWLDNVTWQIFAAGWACLFAVCSFWPFDKMENPLTRGIYVVIASWVLGWITAKSIYVTGLGADWVFPLVGTSWFFLAFFCFNGENWIVQGLKPARQFFILLILIGGLTFVLTHTDVGWIPAWWFPFNLVGAGTGTLAYLTRGMRQPEKSVTQMSLLFLVAGAVIWASMGLGFWDADAEGVAAFWNMGAIGAGNEWLVFFMVGTSINFALPVLFHNWPFSHIPMPWGGILACCFYLVLDVVVTMVLLAGVGSLYSQETLLTYAYMGVNWSLVIPLVFGVGLSKPYLWRGQRTPGSWEDVDETVPSAA
ncbi:hypothetical protein [Methyloligella solikamskensis]|uniref:Uncharacterized protein n=1 Tax=Methyloligella solikamskensis TaxID=1177756 RepID=A0ABW3J7L0_9HYPH